MRDQIVIHVRQRPLPRALTESHEYGRLSVAARDVLLENVRYIQELPYKLREWLDADAPAAELEALVDRVDLDITIHLGVPKVPEDAVSAWVLRSSWVSHSRALTSFLEQRHVARLNEVVPAIGASVNEVEAWVRRMSDALSELLEAFFEARTFDQAVACLVAVHVCLAGLKFGFGRVGLQYPK